jgi:HEAT repeats
MWPLLQDAAADVRRGAAFALLEAIDPADSKQAAAFAGLLDDKDATIRGLGLAAIKEMRRENQVTALPRLAAMLDPACEEKADNRATVARLLASLKVEAGPALEKVVAAAARDPDAKVRTACLVAISQIAPPQQSAVPLARGLTDQDASVRQVAVARLRLQGAAAAPAAKELAAALADDGLRESVAEVLILIGAPAVQPIVGQLTSKNVEVRKYALACLAKIGPAAKDALPAVEKCRQDPDEGVRTLATTALRHIQGK